MIVGITRGEDLLDRIDADHQAPLSAAISSPGGCGKTAVLAAIGAAYRRAGVPVLDLRDAPDQLPSDAAILFDDAHLAETAVLDVVEPLIDSGESRLFIAFRPWPAQRAISRLTAAIRRVGPVVELHHLDREGVERRARAQGSPLTERTLDQLVTETGGLPLLVDEMLTSWAQRPPEAVDEPTNPPAELLDRLRRTVDQVEPAPRRLLQAVALGADLDADSISRLLDIESDAANEAIRAAYASGFLMPDGRVIPLVAAALERASSPQRTNDLRLALLSLRTEQRRDGVPLARSLAHNGVRDGLVADVLATAGDQHLTHDPVTAFALYEDAIEAGASPESLALKRAAAAARAGRFDRAMQLVDPMLADQESPHVATAVYIAAAVMAHRGLFGRAADLYTWLGPVRIGNDTAMAIMALLATGQRAAARRLKRIDAAPTMAAGARALMSDGVAQSIESSAATALSTLMRSTTLLESAEPTLLLPDTPAAVTTLVAVHTGDLDLAESAMRRAIELDLGGSLSRCRHRLLLAWVAMLRGHLNRARELLNDAVLQSTPDLSPRDELFASALRLGIARRASDAQELLRAWSSGRDALFRHPVDLFVLLPLGEFVVAAARLRESERVSAHLADARRLLEGLGEPIVWSTTLHWCGVQAAILNNRPADVEPHAAALVAGAPHSSFASALASAGRAWIRILADEVDPNSVESAAQRLRTFGLAWDGSRLLGQAAAHSGDRRTATALLQAARSLQDHSGGRTPPSDQPVDGEQLGSPSASAGRSSDVLSARELEVAALLVQQRTYREIGSQLYISSKTVEHHVARIKQRLGASGRADLLARLRVIIDDRESS